MRINRTVFIYLSYVLYLSLCGDLISLMRTMTDEINWVILGIALVIGVLISIAAITIKCMRFKRNRKKMQRRALELDTAFNDDSPETAHLIASQSSDDED